MPSAITYTDAFEVNGQKIKTCSCGALVFDTSKHTSWHNDQLSKGQEYRR